MMISNGDLEFIIVRLKKKHNNDLLKEGTSTRVLN